MNKVIAPVQWVLRIAGAASVLLGLAFWGGYLLELLPVHMALGVAVVLALWTLSGAALARADLRGWGAALVVLGLVVIALGITQTGLLPGSWHWVIRLVHLLLGVGAVSQGERLARRLRAAS